MKTSVTHPLRIDTVGLPNSSGLIGITFCPGKKGRSIFGGIWNRDLQSDLSAIDAWKADVLVTLLEDHEFKMLQVPEFKSAITNRTFLWRHLPITDGCAPDDRLERQWRICGSELREILNRGGRIVVHCRGGLGRAGTVAARLLIELGFEPQEAMQQVREARHGAIETREQEEYLLGRRWPTDNRTLEYFAGCLLGGAVGDALGGAVEFDSIEDIRCRFGSEGIIDYAEAYGRVGAITDDTQMTLFTAEGLLCATYQENSEFLIDVLTTSTYQAYLRWLVTQKESVSDLAGQKGWLLEEKDLYHRRAPGGTCLSALSSGRMGSIESSINNSKGCGGVMRVAPVGLYLQSPSVLSGVCEAERDRITILVGCNVAATTHGHPSGYLSAGAFALLIARIVAGDALSVALEKVLHCLNRI